MMRRFIVFVVLVPLAIVLIFLSVANRHQVIFSLDPLGQSTAISWSVPLFVVFFAALVLGILVGGVATWLGQGHWRREARLQRAEADRARAEADRLRHRLTDTPALSAPRDAA